MNKILFRKSLAEEEEFNIASQYFDVIESRALIEQNDFVIPRYSALPYFEELEKDINILGGRLINNYQEHRYIANLFNWYNDLKDYTPKTWNSLQEVDSDGPFVLKGETNSRKHLWNTHMFAADKDRLKEVYFRLQDDSLIGSQDIIIREYESFKAFDYGIGGIPITKEFRFFCYGDKVLASGYYWSNFEEIQESNQLNSNEVPKGFLKKIMKVVSAHTNFYVLDVAQRKDLKWRLVEINDGMMSGLSMVNAHELYSNLKKVIGD